ncbi:DUF3710 domain-containing protein [Streptomyces sp. TRM68416]|uniref:DUF3710 domain-containing protein n=1 Tax=Streptomyces sp. TRM68416 TaxID=2758412 RepID=UPI001661A785|nr:DUF3710 domain-containing protein [Streptomyces sp. TRM68416]
MLTSEHHLTLCQHTPHLGGTSVRGASGNGRQTVRVLGCDGPGWVLRGFATGDGAEPDSTEEWIYTTFQGTVVASSSAPRGTDASMRLRWPEQGGELDAH